MVFFVGRCVFVDGAMEYTQGACVAEGEVGVGWTVFVMELNCFCMDS